MNTTLTRLAGLIIKLLLLSLLTLQPKLPLMASEHKESIIIDAIVEPESPYIQQQVRYTLRLWRRSHLQRGYFMTPDIPDALLIPAPAAKTRKVIRDGQKYELLQQSYFIFPQRSGEIILPEPVFSSQALFIKGQPLSLRVKPWKKKVQPWVIAKNITLEQQWNLPADPVQIGQPIERSVVIHGIDITGAQLPRPMIPHINNMQIQTLASETSYELLDDRIYGTRIERYRYIPKMAGDFQLNDINISWWDNEKDSVFQTVLPGRKMRIYPAADIDTANDSANQAVVDLDNVAAVEQGVRADLIALGAKWILLFLLLLSIGFLIWKYRIYPHLEKKIRISFLRRKVLNASSHNDIARLKDHLLHWAQLKLNCRKSATLLSLQQFTSEQDIINALSALDQALYSGQTLAYSAMEIKHSLKRFMSTAVSSKPTKSPDLPDLWQIQSSGQH